MQKKTLSPWLLILGFLALSCQEPRPVDYHHLRDPHIIKTEERIIMRVDFHGPHEEKPVGQAMKSLFNGYYDLPEIPKTRNWPPLFGRYENHYANLQASLNDNSPSIIESGFVARELPEGYDIMYSTVAMDGSVALDILSSETMAEVVHFGHYRDEGPSIERLMEFIEDEGYKVSGPHEEVYIRGPGFGSFIPRKFITLIRYPVEFSE